MPLTKDQKSAQIKDLSEKIEKSQSMMFAQYIGLNVAEISDLRKKLKESDAEMKVSKKTLLKIAAENAGISSLSDDVLEGPISTIFSFADPLSGAQIAFTFSKDHPQVKLLGGVFEGNILSKEQAIELAKMPSQDVLRAMFVGLLRSPLSQFMSICSSPLGSFVRAMKEISDKKQSETPEKVQETNTPPEAQGDTQSTGKNKETASENTEEKTNESDTLLSSDVTTEDSPSPSPDSDATSDES